jgi:hypothetical protein
MFAFVGLKDTTKFAENSLCKSIKDSIKCQLETLVSFKGCKYEDWQQQNGKSAILGLHSNWIGTNILGTSRPSDKLIQEHNIIAQVTALLSLCVSLYVFVCMSLPMSLGWIIICLHPNWFQGFIEFLSCDHDPFGWNSMPTCVIFILVQFKRCGISCIFNLQVPGEHANCGPGVKNSSGFSYTPEILMQNNCV